MNIPEAIHHPWGLSLSGPWLSVLAALGWAASTGAWIPAAAAGAVAVTVVAVTGLVLAPR